MSGWTWIRIGAVLAFLGVALGAFGGHGLKERLETKGTTATYQTAVQYHMTHALAVVAVGLVMVAGRSGGAATAAGWSFLLGVILFSGSLYTYAITGEKWWGRVTPFGGILMLVGWLALAVAAGGKSAQPAVVSREGWEAEASVR